MSIDLKCAGGLQRVGNRQALAQDGIDHPSLNKIDAVLLREQQPRHGAAPPKDEAAVLLRLDLRGEDLQIVFAHLRQLVGPEQLGVIAGHVFQVHVGNPTWA